MKKVMLLVALLAALPLAGASAEVARSVQPPAQQVAALFATWQQPGKPGAVVEVIRDGKVLLSQSYGLADIERKVPMTASTVFTVGSNSKQFTALAIYLLEQDGKLSLDDDIRKVLPEVPDFGKKITIRHLLHHTSGLRDFFSLMLMTGWRIDEVVTEDDILSLVKRQRALNFEPGQEHLYSNTGYALLSLIVQRVSGKPLADFARERIFEPLGMKHTRFLHGYGTLVPGRALSYLQSANGGYDYVAVGDSADGAGGLVSTAADLAQWDRNFYDGRVGGKALLARMQEPGVLNKGTPIGYASGLLVGVYRGKRMVEHGGAIGGFQTQLSRFPDQHFSVMVLSNAPDLNIYETVRRIADIYLGRELDGQPLAPRAAVKEVEVDPARLDALAGYYALSALSGVNFTKENGRLMAQPTGWPISPVFARSERTFFTKALDAQFTFDAPDKDGIVAGGVLKVNGNDIPARRSVRPVPLDAELKKFVGDFYSDELRVLYSVASKDGGLVLTYPRGTVAFAFHPQGEFFTLTALGDIKYQCSAQEACTGFTLSNGRVRNLQFTRVKLSAP